MRHVLALGDGNLACLPTNRIAWRDGYFIGAEPDPTGKGYVVQSEVYRAESADWDVSEGDEFFYDHPDVKPWFHTTTEPGPYTDDPEDGYPYDE